MIVPFETVYPSPETQDVRRHHYRRTEIADLKTHWVHLLLAGTVLQASSGGIFFILAYPHLNSLFGFTDYLLPIWDMPPVQSMAFSLCLVRGIVVFVITAYALNHIRASEIGNIRPLF